MTEWSPECGSLEELHRKTLELYRSGKTFMEIADQLGVPVVLVAECVMWYNKGSEEDRDISLNKNLVK